MIPFKSSFLFLLFSVACSSCSDIITSRSLYRVDNNSADRLSTNDKIIKVHLTSGRVAVLRKWDLNHEKRIISGNGFVFNAKRQKINSSPQDFDLDYDDCVLVEANEYVNEEFFPTAIMVLTTALGALTLPCLANPKTCFGSCPTYYLHDGDSLILQAEGFSSSITESMEEIDIDALPKFYDKGDSIVRLELKNEALETHYIRKSEILAFRQPYSGELHFGNDEFFYVDEIIDSIIAVNSDPKLRQTLQFRDGDEFFTLSDAEDLKIKESIIIEFPENDLANPAVLITKRQSLMTTYLFYQSLAYMGSRVGDIMAFYERSNPLIKKAQKSIYDLLGGIEISVLIKDKWKVIGTITEQGPIASDSHLLPFDEKGSFHKVKLTMTKGLWRIDQVSLCNIRERGLEPKIIPPSKLINNGQQDDSLLFTLVDPKLMLVNNPGTSYTLEFDLPKNEQSLLFLKTQGYYTEWIRSEWLTEEDPTMIQIIIRNPAKWLKVMAPRFKAIEDEMETLFWSSKYQGQ